MGTEAGDRLTADARRSLLLDVTRTLYTDGGAEAVTMGSVADRAEVTRALVYKHFANRDDILLALYRREAAGLDLHIRRQVEAAPDGLEAKLRAFVVAIASAGDSHGGFFAPLRSAAKDPAARREQRSWDRRTVSWYADLAADELGVEPAAARTSLGICFSGVVALLGQLRGSGQSKRRNELQDIFVRTAMAALVALADDRPRS